MSGEIDFSNPVRGWHFTASPDKFAHGGRVIPADGRWLVVRNEVSMCNSGLHFSVNPLDALQYAPGHYVFLIEAAGVVVGIDKCVARARRIVARADAEEVLRKFARQCAADVLHLWNAPQIVKDYLASGDEKIRAYARNAARDATRDAQNTRLEKLLLEVVSS